MGPLEVRAVQRETSLLRLRAALGTSPYERSEARRGCRNGVRERMLTGPTGPVALALPRATLFRGGNTKEWTSTIVPRYQRRMREVFRLVASGQIKLRQIDGWRKIAAVLSQHTAVAA